jgi:hypothetical protein
MDLPHCHQAVLRIGLLGCVVQLACALTVLPVRLVGFTRCQVRRVMQSGTGQTRDTQVAAHAFVFLHLEMALAVFFMR